MLDAPSPLSPTRLQRWLGRLSNVYWCISLRKTFVHPKKKYQIFLRNYFPRNFNSRSNRLAQINLFVSKIFFSPFYAGDHISENLIEVARKPSSIYCCLVTHIFFNTDRCYKSDRLKSYIIRPFIRILTYLGHLFFKWYSQIIDIWSTYPQT